MDKNEAWKLLNVYNKEAFHLKHAQTVALVMRWFAENEGYADEADFWETAGLLHDLDFEMYPERHCVKAREIMSDMGLDEKLVHAVASHGHGICIDLPPEHHMEKVLFAVDELTGLIGAAALRERPGHGAKVAEKEV